MAQRTQVLYVDDIDGSEAAGTVRFGLGGHDYEIDLSQKHADELTAAISPFIAVARKVPSGRRPARATRAARHDQSDVRAWAAARASRFLTAAASRPTSWPSTSPRTKRAAPFFRRRRPGRRRRRAPGAAPAPGGASWSGGR